MRSKILQVLLLIVVIPFIGWTIFQQSEVTPLQYREVRLMDELSFPMVEAAAAVALDDRKMTQAEFAGIKKIAAKYRAIHESQQGDPAENFRASLHD